jgi:hypothetical protein
VNPVRAALLSLAGARPTVDRLVEDATRRGWRLLFEDRHPFAGGPEHYAAYLEDDDGFEIELVAGGCPGSRRS